MVELHIYIIGPQNFLEFPDVFWNISGHLTCNKSTVKRAVGYLLQRRMVNWGLDGWTILVWLLLTSFQLRWKQNTYYTGNSNLLSWWTPAKIHFFSSAKIAFSLRKKCQNFLISYRTNSFSMHFPFRQNCTFFYKKCVIGIALEKDVTTFEHIV